MFSALMRFDPVQLSQELREDVSGRTLSFVSEGQNLP
jgi:hypothetical protein